MARSQKTCYNLRGKSLIITPDTRYTNLRTALMKGKSRGLRAK
jgi:hypothetical protein